MKKYLNNKQDERGNVLFLILIAVALFAALSYAVTQSTRTGGGSGDNETALISSAQLTQYPASLRTAVVRMVIGGVDIQNLEFNTPANFGTCGGAANELCVFHPNGGGATYTQSPGDMMKDGSAGTWVFNAENEINLLGTSSGANNGTTTSTADLIAFLPNISLTLCSRINDELGLPSTTIPTESGIDLAQQMTNGIGVCNGGCGGTIGSDVATFDGQPYGCFNPTDADLDGDTTNNNDYVYYHVLIER